jgi:hypothetical protein
MVEDTKRITVFISGTSETEAERLSFKELAEELSSILEPLKKLRIKVIMWTDNFTPGVNKHPQDEIRRQSKDQYQIYLGVLIPNLAHQLLMLVQEQRMNSMML